MMIFQNFNKCLQDGRLPANHSLSLVLTGGEYDMQHDALFGCIAVASLEAIKCHTSIIGTSGITLEKGGGPHSHALTAEKVIKEAIFKKKVEHRIIVCDHTKLGREDSLLCGKIEDIVKDADKCTIVIGCPCAADFVMHKIGYILEEVLTEEDKQKQISGKISSVWDKGDWSPETYNQIKEILSGVLTEEGMKEYIRKEDFTSEIDNLRVTGIKEKINSLLSMLLTLEEFNKYRNELEEYLAFILTLEESKLKNIKNEFMDLSKNESTRAIHIAQITGRGGEFPQERLDEEKVKQKGLFLIFRKMKECDLYVIGEDFVKYCKKVSESFESEQQKLEALKTEGEQGKLVTKVEKKEEANLILVRLEEPISYHYYRHSGNVRENK